MPQSRVPGAKDEKQRVRKILRTLAKAYPEHRTELAYRNPLELLVATVLSAQCTDVRVNLVTPKLFARYRTAADFAEVTQARLEKEIHSTGFFRQKAKAIRGFCAVLVDQHNGEVPADMEQLVALPGVGRKTANLVLGEAFGVPGIVVDTHAKRVSGRLGLTRATDPDKVERDLAAVIPKRQWYAFSGRLVRHGRYTCVARKPKCPECVLNRLCPSSTV